MAIKFIDTHAHLNLPAFQADLPSVVEQCALKGVAVINIGTTLDTSRRAVELALEYAHCYAMVGLHPIQVAGEVEEFTSDKRGGTPTSTTPEEFNVADFKRLATLTKKVVGIGECGFDYFHTPEDSYARQEVAFIKQIELANELQLPLMIHTRGPRPGKNSPTGRSVYQDVYEVLKTYAKVPGNIHFYAGTYEETKKFIDLGFCVSFTGVITFAKEYEGLVKALPLESIHAETDCPYVAPLPYRGKRCEPWMVEEVYKKIASLKNESVERVSEILRQNAKRLYNLNWSE